MKSYVDVLTHLVEKPKCWLVTGAAGFIGSNLVEHLLKLNQRVIGIDNFSTGFKANLPKNSDNFKFFELDVASANDLSKLKKLGINYILHQAALGSVPRSIEDPISSHYANVDGQLNILEFARLIEVEKVVYASSSSVYGDSPSQPKVEHTVGNPLSPYALTKKVNEQYAEVYARVYGLNVVGIRYFNVFGPRQDPNSSYAAVVPKWISALMCGEEVYINGDGSTSRDFCFVENVVEMNILAALSEKDVNGTVFNCACSDSTNLLELFETIKSHLLRNYNDQFKILQDVTPIFRDFRVGDVKHSLADISLAKKHLGYKVLKNFDEGMKETIDWYVSQVGKNYK